MAEEICSGRTQESERAVVGERDRGLRVRDGSRPVIDERDTHLQEEVDKLYSEKREAGLAGLVGGLEAVIINVEPNRLLAASEELLRSTGHDFADAFRDPQYATVVLRKEGSCDLLLRARLDGKNPFQRWNLQPKSRDLPNTRLETFVFRTRNIEEFVSIQRSRGVSFLTDDVIDGPEGSFIQTAPSVYTGNSIGFIKTHGKGGGYRTPKSETVDLELSKPDLGHLSKINHLDHAATRIRAEDRDAAMLEFISLTDYAFDFAIYVKELNSITTVARERGSDFAMVFTSGISPSRSQEVLGPTEKFVFNYGPRVHHIAFQTEDIEETCAALVDDGTEFLIGLVGSQEEGLKQTFSQPSVNTLLVNEYIHRYGGFDGFFTKSNVTLLTEATDRQ